MDRQKVKSGLGLMFWGNIVALFAVIPILGVIAALVGGIMELIAIVNLRKQSENYNNAFWFTIIGIVLGPFCQWRWTMGNSDVNSSWPCNIGCNLLHLHSNRGMCKYSILRGSRLLP